MREIKFRAWDPERNNWTDNEEYGSDEWYADYVHMSLHSIEDFQDEKRYEKFMLEQYTGLKDKNGKEIYEGDIIKEVNAQSTEINMVVVIPDVYYTVEACGGFIDDWEVIGNIHENPELQGVN